MSLTFPNKEKGDKTFHCLFECTHSSPVPVTVFPFICTAWFFKKVLKETRRLKSLFTAGKIFPQQDWQQENVWSASSLPKEGITED